VIPWGQTYGRTPPREDDEQVGTPELFPGEREVRETATQAGWSPSVGNGFVAVFVSPYDDDVTLRAHASFFEASVRSAFLLVETLKGDPVRAPLGLQLWVTARGGRIPSPEEAKAVLGERGTVCQVGDLMPEDLTVEA
jgi:hypothetical protein